MVDAGKIANFLFLLLALWPAVLPAEDAPAADALSVTQPPTPKTVEEIFAKARKSVVVITFEGRDGERQGLGSGFIISPVGLIATNLHVIGEARPIQVKLADDRKFPVSAIHATSKSQDLAILKVDATDLPALELADSDALREGAPVIALGNPVGLQWSVVSGVLSGRRDIEGRPMLQIAMPIERGNSGGPLLDMEGRVHGVVTLKSLQTANLGFAVPGNSLKPLLENPNPIPMSRWLTIGVLDPTEWIVRPGGRWRQRAGRILVEGEGTGFGSRGLCLSTEPVPAIPFEVAVQVRFSPREGAAGLVVHSDGKDRHYGFYISGGRLRFSRFDGPDVYAWQVLTEIDPRKLLRDGWNDLKIRVEAERMICYLNDEAVIQSTDTTYRQGAVGLCKFRQTEAEFRNFEVAKNIPSRQADTEIRERIDSLVNEVRDDQSPRTQLVDELTAGVPEAPDLLAAAADELERRAARIRRLGEEIHVRQTQRELKTVIAKRDGEIDLMHAALLVARLDNREVDVDAYLRLLDRMAGRIGEQIPKESSPADTLRALDQAVFEELGFHGSRTDYSNRSNSYLNEVLDDREGLPITLSIIYLELARRLDLPVVGIGLPGHFMVRYQPKEGAAELIDVFDRGKRLTREEAMSRVEELGDIDWDESYLDPQPAEDIIVRMLRNLFSVARDEGDRESMLRYTDSVLTIRPESEQDRFFRAVLCYQTDRLADARTEVNWLLHHDNQAISREAIVDLDRALTREERRRNE